MKSQQEHKIDYLSTAYKQGLTLQVDLFGSGEWIDAGPNDHPDVSPLLCPERWRVKEEAELIAFVKMQDAAFGYLSQFKKEKRND